MNPHPFRKLVGALPIVDTELREAALSAEDASKAEQQPKVVTRTRVTADGTYATESVYTASAGLLEIAFHLFWRQLKRS